MSRAARREQVLPGLPHHIVTRGNNRRRLFSYARDYHLYLRLLEKIVGEIPGCAIHQITLMANHTHAIVTPASVEALSSLMKRINQIYAQRRNWMRNGSGRLFEERYWSKPITDPYQLGVTMAYNDTNAYQADLADWPLDHRWSTGPLHLNKDRVERRIRALWTPSVWYQGLGGTPDERASAYREFVADYLEWMDLPRSLEGCWWLDDLLSPYTRRLERPDRVSAR